MIPRNLSSLLLASTFALAMGTAREGRASECGTNPEYVARNVTVTFSPPLPCVVPSVDGSNRGGCEDMALDLENHCTDAIIIPNDVDMEQCGEFALCQIPPGGDGWISLDAEAEGHHSFHTSFKHGNQKIRVTVSADIVNIAGCSVGAAGAGRAREGAWALGLGAAVWAWRRRRGASGTR